MGPSEKKGRSQSRPPANTTQELASTLRFPCISLPEEDLRLHRARMSTSRSLWNHKSRKPHREPTTLRLELPLKGLQNLRTGPATDCTRNTFDRKPRERICRWTSQVVTRETRCASLEESHSFEVDAYSHNKAPDSYQLQPLHRETLHNQATPDERVHATLPRSASCSVGSFDITSSTTKLTRARSQSGRSPEGYGDQQQEKHLHEHPLNESPPLRKTPPLSQIEQQEIERQQGRQEREREGQEIQRLREADPDGASHSEANHEDQVEKLEKKNWRSSFTKL